MTACYPMCALRVRVRLSHPSPLLICATLGLPEFASAYVSKSDFERFFEKLKERRGSYFSLEYFDAIEELGQEQIEFIEREKKVSVSYFVA